VPRHNKTDLIDFVNDRSAGKSTDSLIGVVDEVFEALSLSRFVPSTSACALRHCGRAAEPLDGFLRLLGSPPDFAIWITDADLSEFITLDGDFELE
jgi:hypothetical protein